MGADMLGIICKGPKYLNESLRDTAVLIVEDRIGRLRDFVQRWDDESLADAVAGASDDFPSEDEVEEVCRLVDCQDIEDILRGSMHFLDPERVVRDFTSAWCGNFRDVMMREDPDDPDQKIVVTGEMSWGDEPQGDGYVALRNAERFGLFDLFGIR